MTFFERYRDGETTTVYAEIAKLGTEAFTPLYHSDIKQVLEETFRRVAYNLQVIHEELVTMDYLFKTEFRYSSEKPLVKPFPNTEKLLKQLEAGVKPFGYVPESLKMLYRAVGGCNFAWDYGYE
jgi:hypothetical protein